MNLSPRALLDANEAVASVAYRLTETIAIYPITPSSPMAEHCDEWAAERRQNLLGSVPGVVQLQSEGGVAGAVHGALQGGSLTTTFTASQGLLLMIPNLYKIAGELNAFCMHVTARSLATHALSIFGDHSDVMACRQTGFVLLASNSVQEAQDLAAVSHAATLASRVPFLHFFDGFRTSHEINAIDILTDDQLRPFLELDKVAEHRDRGLTPDRPFIRGTAQNPDVFFQAREAATPYYAAVPAIIQGCLDRFAEVTGRRYQLYEYAGDPEAERVIVVMGSGAETVEETARYLNRTSDGGVGVLKVRLYRPFDCGLFLAALPPSVRRIAVLDRTKEPGSLGEPLYQDVVTAFAQAAMAGDRESLPRIAGGRFGLGSKEFNPAMAKAVFDHLAGEKLKHGFTVGINDDVSGTSLPVEEGFSIEPEENVRAVFFGLGSDGTVGANKNSVKIIGEESGQYAQAYFVYDSKKSGAMTVSHLRFGPEPIRAPYLIDKADFVGVHQWQFVEKFDVLERAAPGAIVLLNTTAEPEQVWSRLPREVQEKMVARGLKLYAIDAYKVARENNLGGRINTIMQTCFFAISGVMERQEAIRQIKNAIEKTYAKKGRSIVERNCAAVDKTLENLHEIEVPVSVSAEHRFPPVVPEEAPDFVQRLTAAMLRGEGDRLPVSAFPPDGTWPTGTARWEKRNIANQIPVWDPEICIQCNRCALVCPHATIRAKLYDESALGEAPGDFQSVSFRSKELKGKRFTIQVAPEDCTGCGLCVEVCPAKDKGNPRHKAIDMTAKESVFDREKANWEFFQSLPLSTEEEISTIPQAFKASQFHEPLFEFSGACAGCGETPYIKLMTQLFGDRLVIANATGCSSIYGGNLPTTPYTTDADGRGPAWSNSLFEDNAEFGLGLRLAHDKRVELARNLLMRLASDLGDLGVSGILEAPQTTRSEIDAQRGRVTALRRRLREIESPEAQLLDQVADALVDKSVWIVGGDGWAYDIGYGGLDHVLASGRNVNVLVLDTEVYSNTGGQQSKSTPLAAVAKFAASGKAVPKKDLGLLAMNYGHVYVARVALGAKENQTVQAFVEAERHPGPSLILAYSHCIAHGYNLTYGMEQQKLAVSTGYWPLYRFDPANAGLAGVSPFQLDSGPPKKPLSDFLEKEARFRMLATSDAKRAEMLAEEAQKYVSAHYRQYQELSRAGWTVDGEAAQASSSSGTPEK